jgi:rod shape-determining protein MreC
MLRKPHLILWLAVALGAVMILALPEPARARLRVALSSLYLPLFGLAGSVEGAVDRASLALTPPAALAAQRDSLEQENAALRMALLEAQAAARESDRLREMAGYAPRAAWRLLPARVIGRDPSHWWRSVHLDVGLRQGVTPNLAVMTPDGLVGRVAESGPWTSRVVLIGDPNCPVAAALADSGETGIIRGVSGGELHGEVVDFSYLSRNALVRPGQRVVTSGQGGVFPAGVLVGEVVDARMVGEGIFLEARVRLAVNLGALSHVWVKLP